MGKARKRGKKLHLKFLREKARVMRERKKKHSSFIDINEGTMSDMAAASTLVENRDETLALNTSTWKGVESQSLLDDEGNSVNMVVNERQKDWPLLFRDLDDGTVRYMQKSTETIDIGEVLQDYPDINCTNERIENNIARDRETFGSDLGDHADLQYDFQRCPEENDEQEESGNLDGRRIVDVNYFLTELKTISSHSSAFECGITNLELIGENRRGLCSKFKFKCNMCNIELYIETCENSPTANLNVNTAAVASAATTGVGYTQLQGIFASMNIPFMSEQYYKKIDDQVSEEWEKVATAEMESAAARERQCALDEGRVNSDGIPIIDVIADGCWAKRTYKKNYSSLSGAAAIIGRKFGEVLFLGVKNKYCCICSRAANKKTTSKQHTCFKNYTGSSTNMESEILVEGFKQSLEMYGVIYGRLIADGDASTYAKILEARPYSNYTVEKIECRNHLLRNLCNKLQALTKDTKYKIQDRKLLTTHRILAVRKAICCSIKHLKQTNDTKSTQINHLYSSITNSYNHAFSNHANCQGFYCQSDKKSEDVTAKLRNTALESQIKFIIGSTAANARSLIEDVDSNRCEQFNAIIAKCIGGKRINFCLRRSYQTRCAAAVVSFNSRRPLYKLQKSMLGVSPKSNSKRLEMQKLRANNARCMKNTRRRKICFEKPAKKDQHYGENCLKPDLPLEDLQKLKQTFINSLEKTDAERCEIERKTILQSDCSQWLEMRRNLLTASNFGKIINKKSSTSGSIVKSLLYGRDLSTVTSIQHGKANEPNARVQLEKQENIKIMQCGLFIDKHNQFLGASPDGVVDNDRIVEIKCPLSGYRDGLDEAIRNKKITFWKNYNGQLVINTRHEWYYQVQGQLNITGRKECLFAVWTGSDRPIKVEYIKCDQKLWNDVMVPKLRTFYLESILPELLDPRHTRNMPLREIFPKTAKNKIQKKVNTKN